jgi:peptidoglycan/xylan/chitin deacetylase (PgdA/CDA1 family)
MGKIIIHLFIFNSLFLYEVDAQKQIPVICYHSITESASDKPINERISKERFIEQMRSLHDSGFHCILPDALYMYLTSGVELPSKPILISFDDSREDQYAFAAPILQRYNFKAVFFVMTVTINKRNFLKEFEIKELSDSGHIIGCHTWDHPNLKKSVQINWQQQLDIPKRTLEKLTGKPVYYFAYPYGEWNELAISELKKSGFRAAFQLSGKQQPNEEIYTLRRILVPGYWSAAKLQKEIINAFR